ncbi:MAG: VWA domain-containing protein [Bacteroidetes bacterium]|jgi:hypothetical protein|nr:VWA domain-containing protein [Bacteroidota bacterium]
MSSVDLALSYHTLFAFLGLVVAFAIAWWSYRFPVPPQPPAWKRTFIGLRAIALWLIILLIGQPVLSRIDRSVVPPLVEVLVDDSQSLTLADAQGDRRVILKRTLGDRAFVAFDSDAEVRWSTFAERRRPIERWSPDSLTFRGERTDLAGAFGDLRTTDPVRRPAAVILLTDGNSTTNENPVYEAQALGAPVFAIGIGDTNEPRDLRVSQVVSNATAYAGTSVPVHVSLHSSGAGEETVDVTLEHRGRVADRTTVVLDAGARDRRLTLRFMPDSAGWHRSIVRVSSLRGEITTLNNSASFLTNVLSDKRRILIVSASPNQDAAFIRRSLSTDSSLTVVLRTGAPGGGFLEGPLSPEDLRRADLVILVGIPDARTSDDVIRLIARDEFAPTPLWYLLQRTTDLARLGPLAQRLPVSIEAVANTELSAFFSVPASRRLHPILRSANGADPWLSLPPMFRPAGSFLPRPGAEVLAYVRLGNKDLTDPLLIVRRDEGRRSAMLAGYGLWRWKLLAPAGSGSADLADDFVNRMVRWLTAAEDERRVRVQPDREVFSSVEPPSFTAQVYDESLQPVSDADIEVTARGSDGVVSTILSPLGSGQYVGSLPSLAPGDYVTTAVVRAGGAVLGEDRGRFSVGGINVEFVETSLNRTLLEGLAARTGGAYFPAGDLSGLAERVRAAPAFRETELVRRSDLDLWSHPWTLVIVVLLLSLEWFFRKRSGML